MATNWPLDADDLRSALGYAQDQDDPEELGLYMSAACERIDKKTGRNVDPTRHEVGGRVPVVFIIAARKTAKLWWQQDKKGPRARGTEDIPDNEGIAGIDLPRVVAGMIGEYPPRPGFGS